MTDVATGPEVEKAVRLVWASLWSDAALLYRQELGLDVERSTMAVVVQELAQVVRKQVQALVGLELVRALVARKLGAQVSDFGVLRSEVRLLLGKLLVQRPVLVLALA